MTQHETDKSAMQEVGADLSRARVMLNDVDVRHRVRYVTATVAGVRYEITEAWLMGACRTRSPEDAIRLWHEQSRLAADVLAPR